MNPNSNRGFSYRPRQPKFDASFIHEEDAAIATNMIREQVAQQSRGPRGRQPASRPRRGARKTYNESRMESLRSARNAETMEIVSNELRKKWYAGVKDGPTAMERLEALNTMKCITITVTTRAIGFGTLHLFNRLYEFNNVPVTGTIYQFYRVALAIFEAKVQIVQRSVRAITDNNEDFQKTRLSEDTLQTIKAIVNMPDQITAVINAIGKTKVGDIVYVPKIAKNHVDGSNQSLIPLSETVTYSNLHEVVVALANRRTPRHVRTRFYRNNPIPGTVWSGAPGDPVLMNLDEIMPGEYSLDDLSDDVDALHAKITFIARKAPKYYQSTISYEFETTKAILVGNQQETLRCSDKSEVGLDSQPAYYLGSKVEGNISEYFDIHPVNADEQLIGSLVLLGELPVSISHRYPTYIPRDPRNCSATSTMKYKAGRDIRYRSFDTYRVEV